MFSTNVKNTSDLMSIALQAEREAIRRYTELTAKMRQAKNESAAALFERMVIEEQEHEHLLLQWMAQEGVEENLEIEAVKWRDPNISTVYDDEARDPYQSSPYRALAFAVHNEEIAFRFYTHVAAESDNKAVRKYAEILAREELGHAALLRAERRRAYHLEREAQVEEPRFDPRIIHSEADLLTVAFHIDNYLLSSMKNIAEQFSLAGVENITVLIRETQRQISQLSNKLKNLPPAGKATIIMLDNLKSYNTYLDANAKLPESGIKRLWACCDRSFAFYDAVVESTTEEAIMLSAQKLTEMSLDRIAVLKQIAGVTSVLD